MWVVLRTAKLVARRTSLSAALYASLLLVLSVPAVADASFGVTEEHFEAGTCNNTTCTYASFEKNPSEAFTQAAGHPPWGITKFTLNHSGAKAEGSPLRRIRVDVPPGLAADPRALPACPVATFEKDPSECSSETVVGTTEMEAALEAIPGLPLLLPKLSGTVYNLAAPAGLPLDFGIAVEPAGELVTPVHLFLQGHVSWAKETALAARGVPSGDYHEYFEINNVPDEAGILGGVKAPLIVLSSQLNFNGQAGQGNFLTLPSECSSSTISYLEVESYAGEISQTKTKTPIGASGCDAIPFKPTTSITPAVSTTDEPDGVTVDVRAHQYVGASEINTSTIRDVQVKLPEGLTLDPPAANGLDACSPSQIAIGEAKAVTCPASSQIGTVAIETDLPPHSLTGNVYLGNPSGGPIKVPPFTVYLDAESAAGVSVRLQGSVQADSGSGRLTATFTENPALPFSDVILTLNGGPRAPLANPLVCETGHAESLFTPYTGLADALSSEPFAATGCPSPLPFSLSQTATVSSPNAGAHTNLTFKLTRAGGQQYLAHVKTTLPEGLLADIPAVTLCPEPQAGLGTCPSTSKIGTATATVGSGSEPYSFTGPAYLSGPYNGAPYGLSIPVPAAAGPFDFGSGPCDCVLTRASISVDPHTARVSVAANIPTIVAGVPLRLRTLSVSVEKPNFMFNPTGCDPRAYETTITSTFGSTQTLSTPFLATNCAALPFKPSFTLSTNAHTSKLGGASLKATLTQRPHEANPRSVVVQLPKQLPSRLTTLQKACPEAVFAANPVDCRPLGSEVGRATVTTPVLPNKLTGSAYLVSHGGLSFPDLDLVLEGNNVTIELTGNTQIKNGVTSSTFAAIPDAPISSFTLELPVGPHSALTATANLCTAKLLAPTAIVGQNGAKLDQSTRISVGGCGVRILSKHVHAHTLVLRLRTLVAGRTSVSGKDLRTVHRSFRSAKTFTVAIPLSRAGLRALRHHKRLNVNARVAFRPSSPGLAGSKASTSARFRRR